MPNAKRLKSQRLIPLYGLIGTLVLIIGPVLLFLPVEAKTEDNPRANLPVRSAATDHSALMQGPYETGSEVTRACLECHADAASQVMQTTHWTWESKPYQPEGRPEPVTVGKKNSLNNYCIGIQSNWAGCTSCHAGYGWTSADFDFGNQDNVDCLVCHDQSGIYAKGSGGQPVQGIDLAAAAQSVGRPTRDNCGVCHFNGGGGNGVKHGDLDQHLYNPTDSLDIHMGREDFQCTDCHTTQDHQIRGRSISVSLELENQVACTDCHIEKPHQDARVNSHVESVSCQSCHIPTGSRKDPTKMDWDWSTAGQDRPDDQHTYLKIKGSFVYEGDFIPEYYWYSGIKDRYILGDLIDSQQPTALNPISGDISDAEAKIWPFKVHRGKQPYDVVYKYLLQPRTAGEGGFWSTFDWVSALRLGSQDVGMAFSGQYGFAETEMYWPLSHIVAPKEDALQCTACHGENGRLDWIALGYPGDPMKWGGRSQTAASR
jgi:octaheme c-type cytochrome (tetrathionate reductase family)